MGGQESHALRGEIDRTALRQFCDEVEAVEPLATGTLEGTVRTESLRITLDDGIGRATGGEFDVKWSTTNDYNIHYTDDSGRDCRWDRHPHTYTDPNTDAHFHPPPAASSDDTDVEVSCISVSEIDLVARATVKLWRNAYETESLDELNGLDNPP